MNKRRVWATGLSNPGPDSFEIKPSVLMQVLHQEESQSAMFQINAGRGVILLQLTLSVGMLGALQDSSTYLLL